MAQLSSSASTRIQTAFRPKTQRCYSLLFRTFIALCVYMSIEWSSLMVNHILSFQECLAGQNVFIHILSNYVSVIKTKFIVYDMNYSLLDHYKVFFEVCLYQQTACNSKA